MITARGAFVVQIDDAADVSVGLLGGRVEHVVSGKSAVFVAGGDLLAFMVEALQVPVAPAGDDAPRRAQAPRSRRSTRKPGLPTCE